MNEQPTPFARLGCEAEGAIDAHTRHLLEVMLWGMIHENGPTTIEEHRERIAEVLQSDGTEVVGLSLDHQVDLVEQYADELELQLSSVDVEDLRGQIESLAAQVIQRLAEERAAELVLELEQVMDRHGLRLENLVEVNPLAHLPHRSERREGDDCVVCEYRGVDGLDIDVYEVRLGGLWPVCFSQVRR